MRSFNQSRWFIAVAESHPDFHLSETQDVVRAFIFLEPGKPHRVGLFDKRADRGTVEAVALKND